MWLTAEQAQVRCDLAEEFGDEFVSILDYVMDRIKTESGRGNNKVVVNVLELEPIWPDVIVDKDAVFNLNIYFQRTDYPTDFSAASETLTIYWA